MKLEKSIIEERLKSLPGWSLDESGEKIVREIETEDFVSALELVNKIGQKAEEASHHPDVTLSYGKVGIMLSTHSEGGVTEKDLQLAEEIGTMI